MNKEITSMNVRKGISAFSTSCFSDIAFWSTSRSEGWTISLMFFTFQQKDFVNIFQIYFLFARNIFYIPQRNVVHKKPPKLSPYPTSFFALIGQTTVTWWPFLARARPGSITAILTLLALKRKSLDQ